MRSLWALFGRALARWWREFPFLLALNLIWLLAQATIVLGPPTTAAVYQIAGQVVDGELVDFGDLWRGWRQLAGRAWVWGLAQLAVYGVLGFNFWAYGRGAGVLVLTLRYAWAILLVGWFTLNLYYWPLNLMQRDQRFGTTLSNTVKMALLNPGFTLAYGLCSAALVAVSVLSGVLLGAVLMSWLALWGTLVVRSRLALTERKIER
jgi:hypothetical protein